MLRVQVGEQMSRMPDADGQNVYGRLIEAADGLDKIENLQDHPAEEVYEKAVHILETFFDADEGEDQNLAPTMDTGAYQFGAPPAGAQTFNFGGSAGGGGFNFGGQQAPAPQ